MEAAKLTVVMQRGKIDTFKVEFANGWVELKSQLNVKDRSLVQESTISGKITTTGDEKVEMGSLALGNSNIQTLIQAIRAWGGAAFCTFDHVHEGKGGAGHEHQPLELTVENICVIPDPVAEILLDAINERNPRGVRNSKNPGNGAAGKN